MKDQLKDMKESTEKMYYDTLKKNLKGAMVQLQSSLSGESREILLALEIDFNEIMFKAFEDALKELKDV